VISGLSNALVQRMRPRYHHCGVIASEKCLLLQRSLGGTSAVVAFKSNPRNSITDEREYERTVKRLVRVIDQNIT